MTTSGYDAYNNSLAHTTDNKEKILLMLYDGAIKFVRFARMGIEKKSAKIRGENVSKAMAIIVELDCALDRRIENELVENLSDLYRHIMDRLTVANVNNDPGPLAEVEKLLVTLKEGFEGAVQKELAEAPVQPKAHQPGTQEGVRFAI
ncbi:MAG: flagellar export chaperone FliS [Desulfobacterales bacterium]|nr:flagellar export chaperone FliS [Desulfobacterales bacterium]